MSTKNIIYIKIEYNMTCNECSECNEKYDWAVSIVWECWGCSDCWKKKECCTPNIVADWECITVTEDEDWVIHINTRCNPEIISSDWTVNVDVDRSWSVDVWDLSVKDSDKKVWACDADKNPWTLDQKLVWVNGITITPICSDNGKVQIWFDHSTIDCEDKKVAVAEWCTPDYLWNLIQVQSSRLEKSVNNCRVVIKDKEEPAYYAKLVLADNHVTTFPTWIADERWWEPFLWALSPAFWKPARQSWWTIDVRNSLLRWLKFVDWTASAPWKWWIEITKKWLYQVWFTWSAEFSYWVHAFRVQLYRSPAANHDAYNTIVESRYSWPLGYEPWQAVAWEWGNIKFDYVSNVSWWGWDSVPSVTHSHYEKHIDYPLIWEKTEVEWQAWIGYSASIWAILDRVTVTWNTIVECDVWDYLFVWLKVSTSITHSWDMMKNIPAQFLTGHFALLWADVESWDNWPEAWFSYYANLVHPILN